MKISRVILIVNILVALSIVTAVVFLGWMAINLGQITLTPGDIRTEVTGSEANLVIPVKLTNGGQYAIRGLILDTSVKDSRGTLLLSGATGPLDIEPKSMDFAVTHKLNLNLASLKKEVVEDLVFKDQVLQIAIKAGLAMDPFFKLSASVQAPFEWGAPVSGLAIGEPKVAPHNQTHILAEVPVSFKNNSPYLPITADIAARVVDDRNVQQGSGLLKINAATRSDYKDTMKLFLKFSQQDIERLMFNDVRLSYRAILEGFYGGANVFTMERPLVYDWKAPLSNLQVGSPRVTSIAASTVNFEVPISFRNNSPFLDISTELAARIVDTTSGAEQGTGRLQINAPRGTAFSSSLQGSIRFDPAALNTMVFNDRNLSYDVVLTGQYQGVAFSFKQPLQMEWKAPISNLQVGSPRITSVTSSAISFEVPMSFRNNSPFLDVSIPLTARILNATTSTEQGTGQITVNAPRGASFSGNLQGSLRVESTALSSLITNDRTLRYDVVLQGQYQGASFSLRQPLQIDWKAPLADIQLGSPTLKETGAKQLAVSVPLSFKNNSPIIDLSTDLSANVLDAATGRRVGTATLRVNALRQTEFRSTLEVPLAFSEEDLQTLIFQDKALAYRVVLEASYQGARVSFERRISVEWGAPLSQLTVGGLKLAAGNQTHIKALLPLSFENKNRFIDLKTSLIITVLNATSGEKLGSGTYSLDAKKEQKFTGEVTAFIKFPAKALQTLMFNDATLSFRTEISGDFQGAAFKKTDNVQTTWGAPLARFTLGSLQAKTHNATHLAVTAEYSFDNRSPFLTVEGNLKAMFYSTEGTLIGQAPAKPLTANPNTSAKGTITGYVKINAYLSLVQQGQQIQVKLVFEDPKATVEKVISLTAPAPT